MKKPFLMMITLLFLVSCAGEKQVRESLFYPDLPERPRLQYLTSISSEEDLGRSKSQFMEFLVGTEADSKRINRPYDVGASKDAIYISDTSQNKVLILNLKNATINPLEGYREGTYTQPAGIWVTKDDVKYITDIKRKQVLVYDSKNQYVRSYGETGQFDKPIDVAVYEDMIYISDFERHQISVLDRESGEVIRTIGELGKGDGEFFKPFSITVDMDGNLYVNDSFNFRVQKFDSGGNFVQIIGFHGVNIGGFARPKGIAMDEEGFLYVVDTAFENAQIFEAATGKIALFFGGFTEKPGGMYLPNGVWIDYDNVEYFNQYADRDFSLKYLVYVCNMLGSRKLNVYGFGEWTGAILPGMEKYE